MFFDPSSYGSIILIVIISLGVIFASSNLLKGFKITLPKVLFSEPRQITSYSVNIPLSKIKELEEQV